MSTPTYNRVIRKLVVGFGNLFDDITLVRYNANNTEAERFIVPIAYAAKELYVQRLQADPNLDKKVQITLPRMSFEMTGLSYDADRKQNTNFKSFAQTPSGVKSQYNPVPYDFDFSLYLYVRNIEDGTQIIEHILPFFTPDYTIKLNLIPEMGVVKEIPVLLKDTSYEIAYEGPRTSDTRMIIWTLNFTVKGFIFGAISSTGLIKTSITNILNDVDYAGAVQFNMGTATGTYKVGEFVYQGYGLPNATASGKVVIFDNTNKILTLKEISGHFVSSNPIVGADTGAYSTFNSYKVLPQNLATITVTPNPATTNATDNYTYNIATQETANSGIYRPR